MDFRIIRVLIIVLKALSVYLLPRYLSVNDFAHYALLYGYIYIFVPLVEFQYSYEYNRLFAKEQNTQKRCAILKELNGRYLSHYVILLPMFVWLIHDISIGQILILCAVLAGTHFLLEIVKLLNICEDQLYAGVIQLVEMLWIVVMLAFSVNSRDLLFRWIAIFLCSAISLGIIRLFVRHNVLFLFPKKISFAFHKHKTNYLIPLSMLLLSVHIFLPRYLLNYMGYKALSGVVSYFQSIAAGGEYVLYYFVQAKYLPLLLKGDAIADVAKKYRRAVFLSALAVYFLLAVFTYLLTKYVLSESLYFNSLGIGAIVLVSSLILALSEYYSNLLYVSSRDRLQIKAIFYVTASMLPVYCLLYALSSQPLVYVVSCGLLLSSMMLFIFRYLFVINFTERHVYG